MRTGGKRYFQKIFFGSASLIIISIIALSAVVYVNVEQNIFNHEMATNEKLLQQVEFNINLINKNVQNISQSVYYNQDVRSLMLHSGRESFEHMNTIRRLDTTIVQTNTFIKSIYIYNNRNRVFYSTSGSSFRHEDGYLIEYIESVDRVPVLRPIVRREVSQKIGDAEVVGDILSYFMYEMTDSEGRMDGAVIVNVRLDWLIDNLRMINVEGPNETGSLYILSDNEEFIGTGFDGMSDDENLKRELLNFYNSEKNGIFSTIEEKAVMSRVNLHGTDYLLTAVKIREANWVMLRLQPYAAIFYYMAQLRGSIVLISAIALLFTCIAAFIVSKNLYKPVEGLMRYVSPDKAELPKDGKGAADEFSYITSAYDKISEELKGFRSSERGNSAILHNYFIKRLLIESSSVTEDEFVIFKEEHDSKLNADLPFAVCVLKIDRYTKFEDSNDARVKSALRFAVTNVFGEILSEQYANETIDMGHDEFTVLLNLPSKEPDGDEGVQALCKKAVEILIHRLELSLTASISSAGHGLSEITTLYYEALGNANYRIVYGHGSVLSAEQIKLSQAGHIDFSTEYELVEYIRAGNLRAAQQRLRTVFEQIKRLTYTDIQFSLSHLTHSIETVVFEINKNRATPLDISALLPVRGLAEPELLGEIQESFSKLLDRILSEDAVPNIKKQSMTADTIREYIEKNYYDYNLSASGIADMLRLSPSTVSKVFKENTGMSVPEYINDVRLKNAVQWMRNSNLSVVEIMKKVGIENESYFYKIFKAKFGTTPRGFQREP